MARVRFERTFVAMFNKIIVGVDGLEGGRDALSLASLFAASNPNAAVIAITVFPADARYGSSVVSGFDQDLRDELVKSMRDDLEQVGVEDDRRYSVRVVASGWPARSLHEAAVAEHADLLVLGSCRHGAVGRVLLGDVSRATISESPCAIAIAPRAYRDMPRRDLKRIGVGFNDSPEAERALDVAVELAHDNDAELHVTTALDMPHAHVAQFQYAIDWTEVEQEQLRFAEDRLQRVAAQLDVPVEIEAIELRPRKALEQLSRNVDLLVIGSRAWGAAKRVVLGSTSDWIAHHAGGPVLLVPRGDAQANLESPVVGATHG